MQWWIYLEVQYIIKEVKMGKKKSLNSDHLQIGEIVYEKRLYNVLKGFPLNM